MATTCFIARSAENSVSGALAGAATGGRLARSANTTHSATNKNAIASRSIVRRFIEKLFASERLLADSTLQSVISCREPTCSHGPVGRHPECKKHRHKDRPQAGGYNIRKWH